MEEHQTRSVFTGLQLSFFLEPCSHLTFAFASLGFHIRFCLGLGPNDVM